MKKLLLFCCIFLLTGCTVNYNLVIDKDKATENIQIIVPNEALTDEAKELLQTSKNSVFLDKKVFYENDHKEQNDSQYLNYKYVYNLHDFKNTKFLNWCYNDYKVSYKKNIFTLSTEGPFNCLNHYGTNKIDKAEIVIKTRYKVISDNADEIINNNYFWYIDSDNYTNKPINIEIDINKLNDAKSLSEYSEEIIENYASKKLLVLCSAIILIGICIWLFIKYKFNKNNRI